MLRKRVIQQREIRSFAIGVRLSGFRMARGMIERGLHVRRAPRKHDGIERIREPLQLIRREPKRYLHRLSASQADRFHVSVVLRALAPKLFISSTIGDTDARLMVGFCVHQVPILPSLPTPGNPRANSGRAPFCAPERGANGALSRLATRLPRGRGLGGCVASIPHYSQAASLRCEPFQSWKTLRNN